MYVIMTIMAPLAESRFSGKQFISVIILTS